jgi:eukaryotic-like serine/threonine-protein kinase
MARPSAETISPAEKSRRRWHFAGSVLDERSLELVVNGVDVELERKPLEVLMYLLQHAGEVCTKDELLEGVWPGRILSETVLTKCIGRLREVLGDQDQGIIKTAYGFGYRFIAPVQVEFTPTTEPARFDFRPGDHPPARPLWSLVERLGVGGHGEAWRGRHEKTHEQRVFKFALDEASLGALKREITLFRVINDTLGESARVVKLLDWNLEHVPYFVEAEYLPSGSLADWVQRRGGISAIPLTERLELVAKIATALAAVHSVGVLHKDLKPSNVLMKPSAGHEVDIALSDFGSGGVLDVDHLERLGITRLGFTKTIAATDVTSATPMYLAPEVLAGQSFTVKADIYALGVILYQFLAGDFHKVMSPGWERGIEDELLREDVGLVADGNPAMRLADADVLARRLRTLEDRRAELAALRDAEEKAERSRRLMERARARRFGLILAFGVLVAGLATSTALYVKTRHAQELSAVAATRSNAVVNFLSKDVFSPVSSGTESVKEMNVVTLLTRAGNEVDTRFAGQPDIASELHFVLGRSFQQFLDSSLAVKHFIRALELGENLSGQGSQAAVRSASELVQVDYLLGRLRQSIGRYAAVLDAGKKRLGETAPEVLDLRLSLGRGYYLLGDWSFAERMFRDLLIDVSANVKAPSELLGRVQFYYAQLLIDLAKPTEAGGHLSAAIAQFRASLGERHVMVAEAHSVLGLALADAGRFSDASRELQTAHELALQWAPLESWTEVRPRFFTALMFLHQGQPSKAEPVLADIVHYEDVNEAAYLQAHKGSPPEMDHTGPARQALGEAYLQQGKLAEAIETLRRAVSVSERASGTTHPSVLSAKLSLADALIADRGTGEAQRLVGSIAVRDLAPLPPTHPIRAQWYRISGLLALSDGRIADARQSLTRALDVYEAVYGPNDWRVVRGKRELLLKPAPGIR